MSDCLEHCQVACERAPRVFGYLRPRFSIISVCTLYLFELSPSPSPSPSPSSCHFKSLISRNEALYDSGACPRRGKVCP